MAEDTNPNDVQPTLSTVTKIATEYQDAGAVVVTVRGVGLDGRKPKRVALRYPDAATYKTQFPIDLQKLVQDA